MDLASEVTRLESRTKHDDEHEKLFFPYIRLARNLFNVVVADLHGRDHNNKASAIRWLKTEDDDWVCSISMVSYWTGWTTTQLRIMAKNKIPLPSMGVGHVGATGKTANKESKRKNTCKFPGRTKNASAITVRTTLC